MSMYLGRFRGQFKQHIIVPSGDDYKTICAPTIRGDHEIQTLAGPFTAEGIERLTVCANCRRAAHIKEVT